MEQFPDKSVYDFGYHSVRFTANLSCEVNIALRRSRMSPAMSLAQGNLQLKSGSVLAASSIFLESVVIGDDFNA